MIKNGTILKIDHSRKGIFIGKIQTDFDENKDDFLDVILITNYISGINQDWLTGEKIPCRKSLCTFEIVG